MARRLTTVGSEFQVNQAPGQDGGQLDPDAVTLSDGRFFVGFVDTAGGGSSDIGGQFLTASGALTGPSLVFGGALPGLATSANNEFNVALAARTTGAAAGGFIAVYEDSSVGGGDVMVRIFDAAGTLTAFGTVFVSADNEAEPDVATLSDGRSYIVFETAPGGVDDIMVRGINAAGNAFTSVVPLNVTSSAAVEDDDPAIAAAGLNALIAYEQDPVGSTSTNVMAKLFSGATETVGAEITIAAESGAGTDFDDIDVARLGGDRFIIVYDNGDDVFGKIYDPTTPDGAFLSAQFRINSQNGDFNAEDAKVVATIDGGFIVVWEETFSGSDEIRARRFDARGLAYGDEFTVNTFTDTNQEDPALAISGVNVLISWEDSGVRAGGDTTPDGIRAQAFTTTAFDYDSARFGDFDNNGRDDILYQNDTGDLLIWATNSAGQVASIVDLGSLPANFRVDGTGNFNSAAGDDILLRSPTQVAVLPMQGFVPQAHVVLGGTSPDFLNSGNGDFTGDGQSDLLFRHVNNGQIVTWGVANNALTVAPVVLGSTAATFRIVAVDDFTGDQQSDILFRDETNGDIAVWRVANNALAGVPAVTGSTSQAYHVVGTGDFDGNNSFDILFRNDNGDVAMWLLNAQGQLLGAPQLVGNAALDFHVEGTGDLNGDNRSDIVFRNGEGQLVSWLMNGASFLQPPAVFGVPIAVDFAVAAHHFDIV